MSGFFAVINRLFDLLFWPFRSWSPLYSLTVVSVLTGILMLVVYRFTSDQAGIRRVKDRIKAHLLEVRLFQDQLEVVLQAHVRLLRCTLTYMRYSLRPLAVMILPLLLIMVQLEMRLGHFPVLPGEPFLLTAKVSTPAWLEQTSLRLPPAVRLDSPPLRIPDRREISWRLIAQEPGDFEVGVAVGEKSFAKEVTVGGSTVRLSAKRVQSGLWDRFLYPGEPPLPDEAPLEWIEVQYSPRRIDLGLFQAHWLFPFFGFSIVAGLALKGVLGTEI